MRILSSSSSPTCLYVADDFGLCSSVNESILHSHHHGVLSSASLMLGQAGSQEAISLAKSTPNLELGLHFHFCDSNPTTRQSWPWGSHPASLGFRLGFQPYSISLIQEEIENQWNLFESSGLPLSFINVHHHLQSHPWIGGMIGRFLIKKKFQGWIRGGVPHFFSPVSPLKNRFTRWLSKTVQKRIPFQSPHSLWGIDRPFSMEPQEIRSVTVSLTEGVHEFIFHPRTLNDSETQCLIHLKQSPSPAL